MTLAIETATNVCSVAYKNRRGEIFEKRSQTRRSHSENLFLFIQELIEDHDFSIKDLSAVLVSDGPGSYTGLRISASAVKGLLFGSEVPLYGVNTLASFAFSAVKKHPAAAKIHSIIDARRKHFYHQSFYLKNKRLDTKKLQILPIAEFEQMLQPDEVIIGTGLKRIDVGVQQKALLMDDTFISAQSLIHLFETENTVSFYHKVEPAEFSPEYYSSKKPLINTD